MIPARPSWLELAGRLRWAFPLLVAVIPLWPISLPAPAGERLIAVFPPWWSAAEAVAATAGAGRVVRLGRVPSAIVVAADRNGAAALRRAGAWMLLGGGEVPGCGSALPAVPVARQRLFGGWP